MPCNSDHMSPHEFEAEMSKVACYLDELSGFKWTESQHEGYHPRVYGRGLNREDCDRMVSDLCERLQSVDVNTFSLEMQVWWRDHQAADKARAERQLESAQNAKDRAAALAKLTPHEIRLIGHKPIPKVDEADEL